MRNSIIAGLVVAVLVSAFYLGHGTRRESAAYFRGYAAAVDSVREASAPPETLRVIVRRGESVMVRRPYGSIYVEYEARP